MKTNLDNYWQAYCEGDKQAFEKVYNQLFNPLFFKVINLTEDRDEAKDIVQDTLVKLYQYPDPASIRDLNSWTFKVAKHLFISGYRKVQTKRKYEKQNQKETPEVSLTSLLDKENLMHLLKKYLTPTDFKLLQLEIRGYPIPEIAFEMNMQEKTVYNRRTNIRKLVAQILKQFFILLLIFTI